MFMLRDLLQVLYVLFVFLFLFSGLFIVLPHRHFAFVPIFNTVHILDL